MNKQSSNQRTGQALIEFALVLPLLAFILFAIIQYGFIFAAYITLRNASAVAARHAILSPPPADTAVQDVARAAIQPMLQAANLQTPSVSTTNITSGGTTFSAKRVTLRYDLPLIVPFVVPGKSAGGSLTLSATTVMQ